MCVCVCLCVCGDRFCVTLLQSLVQQMSEETVVKPDISETITSVFIVQLCSSLLPLFSSLSIATMNLLLEISAQIETSSSANISLKIFREILHLGLGENCSVRNNGVSPPPPLKHTHTHTHTTCRAQPHHIPGPPTSSYKIKYVSCSVSVILYVIHV